MPSNAMLSGGYEDRTRLDNNSPPAMPHHVQRQAYQVSPTPSISNQVMETRIRNRLPIQSLN